MRNIHDDGFEYFLKNRFEGVEIEPDPYVWTRIDSSLANLEAKRYRNKLLIFQWVTAASVLLALSVVIWMWNGQSQYRNSELTSHETNPSLSLSEVHPLILSEQPGKNLKNNAHIKLSPSKNGKKILAAGNKPGKFSEKSIGSVNMPASHQPQIYLKLTSKYIFNPIDRPAAPPGPGYRDTFIYETSVLESPGVPKNLWAGVNFGSGYFNPNLSDGSNLMMAKNNPMTGSQLSSIYSPYSNNNNTLLKNSTYYPDITYTYGIGMGGDIGKHWVIHGGINYQFARSYGNIYNYALASASNNFTNLSSGASSPLIGVDNNFEFISIPLTFGYILYNLRIQWIIDAGIAPSFLLKNTFTDPGNVYPEFIIRPGKDSPYRLAYLNGIAGTSFNLNLNRFYRISIQPAYYIGISNLMKNSGSLNLRPSFMQVSGSISYLFK